MVESRRSLQRSKVRMPMPSLSEAARTLPRARDADAPADDFDDRGDHASGPVAAALDDGSLADSTPVLAVMERMEANAPAAASFLKALAHEGRLTILCHLTEGERSVTELERLLGARQSAVSQQLARLRLEGLVDNRRDGKVIYYRISDPRAARLLGVMYEMFCADED